MGIRGSRRHVYLHRSSGHDPGTQLGSRRRRQSHPVPFALERTVDRRRNNDRYRPVRARFETLIPRP